MYRKCIHEGACLCVWVCVRECVCPAYILVSLSVREVDTDAHSSGQKTAAFHLLGPSLGNKNRVSWGLERDAGMMRSATNFIECFRELTYLTLKESCEVGAIITLISQIRKMRQGEAK